MLRLNVFFRSEVKVDIKPVSYKLSLASLASEGEEYMDMDEDDTYYDYFDDEYYDEFSDESGVNGGSRRRLLSSKGK